MKAILPVLSFLLFISFGSKAQTWDYVAYGEVTCNNEQVKLEGAVVTLFRNGSQTSQQVTKKNGKYTFVLAPENEYIISYTKAGFITKRIFISTKNVPPERSKFGFSKQPIDVDLFEMPADPTIVAKINELLTEPMGKFIYVPSAQDFDFDQKYANEVKKKLKELLKIKEELDKKKEDKAFQDAQFQTYVNTGNALYDQGKFNDALGAYTNALNINPGDATLLAKIELTKKKLKEEEDRKALFEKYLAVIKEADVLFKAADWTGAKSKYEAALAIVSTEKYPKDQINLCQIEIDKAKNNAEAKAKYDAAVKEADDFFKAGKYQDAITSYNKALGFIPTEKYPKDQIIVCQTRLKELTDLENKYLIAVQKGDNAFKTRDWLTAKTGYNDALLLKPAEKYPKDQLALIAIEETKDGVEKQYAALILKADGLFKTKDWTGAKSNYEEALKLKSLEKYPKDQIILCQKEIDKAGLEKDVQAKYDAAIKMADDAFAAKNWEMSITHYQKAIGFKPGEKYPSDQIFLAKAELDKIKGQKELQSKYDAAIKEGDDAFKLKKWDAAIVGYTKALDVKPGEKYPTDQIKICNTELEKIKNLNDVQAKYDAAIKEGDNAFKLKKWEDAITAYNKALGIKAAQPYPTGQITLCNAEINKISSEKELLEKYNAAIKEGDNAFTLKKWEAAIIGYNKALAIKPGEKYPTDQVALATLEVNRIKDLQTKYTNAIKDGDKAFKAAMWESSIGFYKTALGLKPMEVYPSDQIKLAEIELAKVKAQVDLNIKYNAAIKEGDAAFKERNWNGAVFGYQKALDIKPEEKYPASQIELCKKELERIKALKDVIAKYNAVIVDADKAFKAKQWSDAVGLYNKALGFMPEEPYPPKQIEICNAELEKIKLQKELDAKYNAAITAGDNAFKAKNWQDASASYSTALELKAGQKYPSDQLMICKAELEKLRAQKDLDEKYNTAIKNGNSNFDAKEYLTSKTFYEEALKYKPNEKLPKDRIAEIAERLAIDKKYNEVIARADKHFANLDWKDAKGEYAAAIQIKNEQYPRDQIAICDQKMLDFKENQENQKKYDAAIKEADLLYKNQDWTNALDKYTVASGIRPSENYPKDRIKEINGILAKLKAEEDKLKAEKEQSDKYAAAVNAGDVFFSKKDYVNAKQKYELAKSIFPTQPYPPVMITKCDQLMKTDPLDKEYQGYIVQGDKAFKENKLQDAKDFYNAALSVKPEEKYPVNKIKEIDAILKDKQVNMEKDMAIKEYQRLIKVADQLFADRNWNKARVIYEQARSLQPVEPYPKERIAQCDAFLKSGNDPTKPDTQVYQTDADYEKARKKRFAEQTARFGGPGRYEVPPTNDGYKVVSEVVIITDTDATIYKKVEFKFGQTVCYKNDIAINPAEYEAAINQ